MNYETTNNGIPIKRTRVSRACNFCRKKKIKCNIDQQMPCSSCVQYRCECTSNDSPRKRPPPKGYIESLEMRLQSMEKLLRERLVNDNGTSDLHEGNRYDTSISGDSDDTAEEEEDQDDNDDSSSTPADLHSTKVIRHIGISSPYYLMGKQRQEDESRSAQLGRSAFSQKLYPELLSDDSNQVQSHLTVSTKQGQLHLVYDDDTSDLMVIHDCSPQHQTLKQQSPPHGTGLDDILPGPLVKYLMQKFVKIRPAMLPMIGTRSILESIHNRPTNPLLISAICSYVTTFTPENDRMFVKYGIDQKRLIQQLEEKEDELLRTAFLEPTISNIQAIIILCCHPTQVTYPSIWLRAGIAIRMSQDLGLHRSLTNTSNSKKVRELGNLLWHCVYILDRWSCAVLGRPLAIVDSDCNVDLPDDSDGGSSHDDEQDYTFFTAFIKLSGILGEIQRRIYSPKAKASLGCHGTSTTNTVNSLQRLLFDWYDQLPLDDRLTDNDMARVASPATTKEEKDALLQSKKWRLVAPLMITYYAVTILLHRPFIIPDNELLFNPTSAKRCMEMAALATDTVALMDVSNFTHFCWNIIVFSLTVPVSIHLFNCSSDQPDVSQTGRHYLNKAMEMYHNLESEFPLAPKLTCNSPLQFAISLLGPQWETAQRLSTSPSVHSSSSEMSRPVDPSSSSVSSFSTVNTRQDQQQQEHHEQPQLHQQQHQQHQQHQQQQSPVRGDAELQFDQPPSFQFEPMDPSQPMTYPLPEVIATSSDSVGLTMENQLPNQDSWQQLFLNNTGQFAFSDGKQSDDFWQCLSLF